MRTNQLLCYFLLSVMALGLTACGGAGGGGSGGGLAPDQLGVAPTETLYVINYADDGPGSLRHAIENALPGAWVVFSPLLAPGTVNLLSEIIIDKPIAIGGLANDGSRFVVSGGNATRIFNVLPGAHLWLNDIALVDGEATSGGAIYALSAQLTIWRSQFAGNNGLFGSGGAIFGHESQVEINDSAFVANSSESGGALRLGDSLLQMHRTSFFMNSAVGGSGGAVALGDVDATIVNSSFLNNMANIVAWAHGGAIMATSYGAEYESRLRIYSSTITGNSAQNAAGGISLVEQNDMPATLELYRSIVAQNNAPDGEDIRTTGSSTASGVQNIIGIGDNWFFFNGIGDNQVGDPFTPLDPLLGPVVGDPLGRMMRVPTELSPANSALAGGTVYGPTGQHLLVDQRGLARDPGTGNEIGAIERNP